MIALAIRSWALVLLFSVNAHAVLPRACDVASVTPIVPAVAGFSVSPRDEAVILFAKPVDGISQIFRFDRRTREERCLPCGARPGAPVVNRHKGALAFLPDGERFVLQVEMAQHPFEGAIGAPGAGWFNDVWLASTDGERWWNLTRHPSGPNDRFGVLLPEPSPDGARLAWAELYADDGAQARAAMKRGKPTLGGARGSYLMELLFAGACGVAEPGAPPPAGAASGFVPVADSSNSSDAAAAPPVPRVGMEIIKTATLNVGGSERTYRLALPKSSAGARPLVFAFHGFGDNKDLMPLYSGLDELAVRHGAIVVYPQSRPGAWPLVLDWARPDFAFFDALIDELDKRYGIDRARVYVTGMSNGAYFVNLLASQRSTVIAAIATHSGGLGALGMVNVAIPRKYPVMIVHGAADNLVKVDEARRAKAYYEQHGHSVRYAELPGHGHHWARGKGINEHIWKFFAAHPLR